MTDNDDWLLHSVLRDNVDLALRHNNKECWSYKVLSILRDVGATPGDGSHQDFCSAHLDVDAIVESWRSFLFRHWAALGTDPRTCVSEGAKMCAYKNWFSYPNGSSALHLHDLSISPGLHRRLMRFRMACSDLEVNSGRLGRNGDKRPRHGRVCRCCNLNVVEDELHFLFDCPVYDELRTSRFSHLFETDYARQHNIRMFMNSSCNQLEIAMLLNDMFEHRKLRRHILGM